MSWFALVLRGRYGSSSRGWLEDATLSITSIRCQYDELDWGWRFCICWSWDPDRGQIVCFYIPSATVRTVPIWVQFRTDTIFITVCCGNKKFITVSSTHLISKSFHPPLSLSLSLPARSAVPWIGGRRRWRSSGGVRSDGEIQRRRLQLPPRRLRRAVLLVSAAAPEGTEVNVLRGPRVRRRRQCLGGSRSRRAGPSSTSTSWPPCWLLSPQPLPETLSNQIGRRRRQAAHGPDPALHRPDSATHGSDPVVRVPDLVMHRRRGSALGRKQLCSTPRHHGSPSSIATVELPTWGQQRWPRKISVCRASICAWRKQICVVPQASTSWGSKVQDARWEHLQPPHGCNTSKENCWLWRLQRPLRSPPPLKLLYICSSRCVGLRSHYDVEMTTVAVASVRSCKVPFVVKSSWVSRASRSSMLVPLCFLQMLCFLFSRPYHIKHS
jgi:hypothetical protein